MTENEKRVQLAITNYAVMPTLRKWPGAASAAHHGGRTVITGGKIPADYPCSHTLLQPLCSDGLFHFHGNGLLTSAYRSVRSGRLRRKPTAAEKMFTKLIRSMFTSALQGDAFIPRPPCSQNNTWNSRLESWKRTQWSSGCTQLELSSARVTSEVLVVVPQCVHSCFWLSSVRAHFLPGSSALSGSFVPWASSGIFFFFF